MYKGKILSDNKDGTYHVRFEDNDEDTRVPHSAIKRLESPYGSSGGDIATTVTSSINVDSSTNVEWLKKR